MTTNGKSASVTAATATTKQKSVLVTYILWLFGGVFGLHHLYLHRDRHAFLIWCSLGGYCGIGWFFDVLNIPEYVREANEDAVFREAFKAKVRQLKKPEYSSKRFMSAVMIGYLFGQLVSMAIPEDTFGGVNWMFLHWLIPFFVAVGVWTVGNVGREKGVLWHSLVAAYLSYPVRYFIFDETYTFLITAIAAALAFDTFSKQWRFENKRRSTSHRVVTLSAAVVVYFSLWGCFMFFNGTIKDEDGGEIPVHEAIKNFLASAWWTDLKQTLYDTYQYGQHHGWYETWKEIFETMDVDGERNAHKVLGVSATASQAEITSAYRKLSKEFHPDKVKDEAERPAANARFMEIQQAYDVLSKKKGSRRRKNKKFNEDL